MSRNVATLLYLIEVALEASTCVLAVFLGAEVYEEEAVQRFRVDGH